MAEFGPAFKKHFVLEDSLVNLNNGSFGSVVKPALDAQLKSLEQRLAFPDKWYRRILIDRKDPQFEYRKEVADIVDADVSNVVFTMNATFGANTVLRSWNFKQGDKIVFMSSIYLNCRNTLEYLRDTRGVELVELKLAYPINDSDLLSEFEGLLDEHKPVLAFFDTVSSMPANVFPWERMAQACRERNVLSYVDAAHGIGLIPISLRKSRPTFFCSNLHKWFYVSQSAAFLYVDPDHHLNITGLPISAFYYGQNKEIPSEDQRTALARTFGYLSTLDYSVFDSIGEAAKFRKEVCGGEEAIMNYQNKLAEEASSYMCKELGVKELRDPDGVRCALFTIESPYQPQPDEMIAFMRFVGDVAIDEFNTYIQLAPYQGVLYLRYSTMTYLDLGSFEYGATVVKAIVEKWKAR